LDADPEGCRHQLTAQFLGTRPHRAGYAGPIEVEVFNADVWARPGADILAETVKGYVDTVG